MTSVFVEPKNLKSKKQTQRRIKSLDHNLIHEATHLWRNVITEIGANHELGRLIWIYELYTKYNDLKAIESERKLRTLVVKLRLAQI